MSGYAKLILYYFSGTGNSACVARWMQEVALQMGMEVSVINITHVNRKQIPVPDENALVAFCSPVHGFNYPPVMLKFISRFPRGKNAVLLMNTRAGMLLGKWVTPGLSGLTFYFSAFVLWLKGYRTKAMFPVDLPSNWISLHPALNARTISYMQQRNKERVSRFAAHVFAGGKWFRSLVSFIPDMLVVPLSIGYYFVGRFFLAKTFYASTACNNCNICIKQCPVQAIKTVDKRPYWTFHCESCMHCMGVCPHRAIETAHGPIIAFMLIFSLIIWSTLKIMYGDVLYLDNPVANFIVQWGLFLGLQAIWYRVLHFLLRYRWFNKLITFTSLTFYRFWGRYLEERKETESKLKI